MVAGARGKKGRQETFEAKDRPKKGSEEKAIARLKGGCTYEESCTASSETAGDNDGLRRKQRPTDGEAKKDAHRDTEKYDIWLNRRWKPSQRGALAAKPTSEARPKEEE